MDILLGIDAGTTNMKVILTDTCGNLLDVVSSPVNVIMPFEGAKEIDMNILWQTLCNLTLQLKERNKDTWRYIKGVGICAQGDGMWAVDANGNPAGNAILWNDTRARVLEDINFAHVDRMLEQNRSTAMFAGAFPVILAWLKRKDPHYYKRINTVFHCKDWLNLKLCGRYASDFTDFSTGGINIFTKEHVLEIYDMLDIKQAKDFLPELLPSTDIVGFITKDAAQQSGISAGTPLIAGAIDVVATAVGAGVNTVGDSFTILGTTLCNEILIDSTQVDVTARSGSTLCSILPDKFMRVMASLSGNSAIDWAKSILAPDISFIELEKQLEHVPMGSAGILYHPYIAGERAPFRNPLACGGFYGLTSRHTRFEMMRAAYEGMVLSIKDCYTHLPQTNGKIYISGGGAVSDFTCQLIASALDKTVIRPKQKELAAIGITEAVKIGINLSGQLVSHKPDMFVPIESDTMRFELLYSQFTTLKNQLEPYWQERQKIINN